MVKAGEESGSGICVGSNAHILTNYHVIEKSPQNIQVIPFVIIGVLEQSMTSGIVSANGRQIEGVTYIQHTAAVNPGNSGGPLLDETGQVIGINTLKAKLEGVSFAIPASRIREFFSKAAKP